MSDLARERAIELENEVFSLNREIRRLHATNEELLEACRDYIAWCSPNTIGEPELKRIREKIRAAIAKAEAKP